MKKLTADQERRVQLEQERMIAQARKIHPERWAPDGSALIGFAGRDWFERLNSWRLEHGLAEIPRPTPKLHPIAEPVRRRNTYSDDTRDVPV